MALEEPLHCVDFSDQKMLCTLQVSAAVSERTKTAAAAASQQVAAMLEAGCMAWAGLYIACLSSCEMMILCLLCR